MVCEDQDGNKVEVTVRDRGRGMRTATHGTYRIVSFAEGGYEMEEHAPGVGWCLVKWGSELPGDLERVLCSALGIEAR